MALLGYINYRHYDGLATYDRQNTSETGKRFCFSRAATLSREADEKTLLLKKPLSLEIHLNIILSKNQFVDSGEANMRSKYDISDCTVKNVV